MERFSTKVRKREKEFTSFRNAEQNALETFETGKRSALERNVEASPSFLEIGKIYTFRYAPLRPDILSYYDRDPLVLIIDRRKLKNGRFIDIGVNLNFLPFRAKVSFMDRITRAMEPYLKGNTFNFANRAKDQRPLPINYEVIKILLGKAGKFALRSYYPNRRSDTYVFSYEKWVDLMFLNIEDIEGANLNQIYKLYNSK